MDITATPFTYQPNDVVSVRQWDAHQTLYKGYVTKVNEISNTLQDTALEKQANATYSVFRGLKTAETFALNGVVLHELYFRNFPEGMQRVPGPRTAQLLSFAYGSVDAWQKDFEATALSARGWAICVYDQRTGRCRNIVLDNHHLGYVCGGFPLVVLDMYEHAYFLDYATDKNTYVARFMAQINWDAVEKRAVLVP